MADKKIGNYVHLRKLNYLRYGTNKPSSNQNAKPDFYTINNSKERVEINLFYNITLFLLIKRLTEINNVVDFFLF